MRYKPSIAFDRMSGSAKGVTASQNKGYGHDSYEFAKDKPLKLLNGGHLLALLQKNGMKGYINIQEAKELNKEEGKTNL